ncbi:hypothetical protein C8R45DRAFT_943108 [Mycena sanguinolenta]|nr:hypothetical protein C8R45DRAFT_943108 [Mycena sanguinolenta]
METLITLGLAIRDATGSEGVKQYSLASSATAQIKSEPGGKTHDEADLRILKNMVLTQRAEQSGWCKVHVPWILSVERYLSHCVDYARSTRAQVMSPLRILFGCVRRREQCLFDSGTGLRQRTIQYSDGNRGKLGEARNTTLAVPRRNRRKQREGLPRAASATHKDAMSSSASRTRSIRGAPHGGFGRGRYVVERKFNTELADGNSRCLSLLRPSCSGPRLPRSSSTLHPPSKPHVPPPLCAQPKSSSCPASLRRAPPFSGHAFKRRRESGAPLLDNDLRARHRHPPPRVLVARFQSRTSTLHGIIHAGTSPSQHETQASGKGVGGAGRCDVRVCRGCFERRVRWVKKLRTKEKKERGNDVDIASTSKLTAKTGCNTIFIPASAPPSLDSLAGSFLHQLLWILGWQDPPVSTRGANSKRQALDSRPEAGEVFGCSPAASTSTAVYPHPASNHSST